MFRAAIPCCFASFRREWKTRWLPSAVQDGIALDPVLPIALAYARSLLGGGLAAVLEVARRSTEPRLGEGLVAFAEDRARRRGCRELAARIDGVDPELRAVLLARGFRPADALVAALVPAS